MTAAHTIITRYSYHIIAMLMCACHVGMTVLMTFFLFISHASLRLLERNENRVTLYIHNLTDLLKLCLFMTMQGVYIYF